MHYAKRPSLVQPITNLFVEGCFAILSMYTLNGFFSMLRERVVRNNYYVTFPEITQFLNTRRYRCPIRTVFWAIVFLNCIVFAAWQKDENSYLLNTYFLLSTQKSHLNFVNLVLSAFSHIEPMHLISNMLTFNGVVEIWKRLDHSQCTMLNSCNGGEFTCFYFSAAIVSSLFGLYVKAVSNTMVSSVGASGVVCSLMAYEMVLGPCLQTSIVVPGYRRINTKDFFYVVVLIDVIGFIKMILVNYFDLDYFVQTDYSVHVCGYAFGLWYATGGDAKLLSLGKKVSRALSKFISYLNEF